jgi:L-idonate 5-dehydrogenase
MALNADLATDPDALPATGPALVAHAAGDLRIDEVPLPRPAPDEAVVEVVYGGICGSDLHYWLHGAGGSPS